MARKHKVDVKNIITSPEISKFLTDGIMIETSAPKGYNTSCPLGNTSENKSFIFYSE